MNKESEETKMRNIVSNNYSNVTVEFSYSDGIGYAIAYSGATIEKIWMPAISMPGKTRDEAELRVLNFLVAGDPRKEAMTAKGLSVYGGFNKNARLRLIGFDAFEKGIKQKHRKNADAWATVLGYFANGRDGLRFDLLSINDTYSSAIEGAKGYCWTALNRAAHHDSFTAMVNNAKKAAKARKAAVAKAEPAAKEATVAKPAMEAKSAPAPKAESKSALQKKLERAMAMTATGIDLDDIMEAIA